MIDAARPRRPAARVGRRYALAGGLAALAGGVLAACGLLPPPGLRAPEIHGAQIAVRGVGRDEIRFLLTLDTGNPNDVRVPLTGLRFDLDLLGQPFATGQALASTLELAPQARTAVPIEFSVPTSRLLAILRELRGDGEAGFPYRLRGSAAWGDSPFPVRFERTGDIDALHRLRGALRPLLGR